MRASIEPSRPREVAIFTFFIVTVFEETRVKVGIVLFEVLDEELEELEELGDALL